MPTAAESRRLIHAFDSSVHKPLRSGGGRPKASPRKQQQQRCFHLGVAGMGGPLPWHQPQARPRIRSTVWSAQLGAVIVTVGGLTSGLVVHAGLHRVYVGKNRCGCLQCLQHTHKAIRREARGMRGVKKATR